MRGVMRFLVAFGLVLVLALHGMAVLASGGITPDGHDILPPGVERS